METLVICLAIATVLPIVAKGPVALAMNRLGGYDNAHPREQQSKLQGFGARALAAHQNAFEALIMFAPAVLCAMVTNKVDDTVQWAAIIFIVMRLGYNVFYLINIHWLRSLVWLIGLGCNLYILLQCAW